MPKFLPPEWYPQSAVMLTWPHEKTDWQPILQQVEQVFSDITKAISAHETVLIVANDSTQRQHIISILSNYDVDLTRVRIYEAPSNDTWARDHGPITVLKNSKALLLDFQFNGWGNKFSADLDNRISTQLSAARAFGSATMRSIDFVLEGGAIETDGNGTLLTTSNCLLAPTRNPPMSKSQIETVLQAEFGVQQILWLDYGALEGDDTDSHIDTLARFCDANTIVYCHCRDKSDSHYGELQQMQQQLASFSDVNGKAYRLIPLPLPAPKFDSDGERLPATYANFLIINNAVLVPVYNDPADAEAMAILQACFPQREIVAINCLPLIMQHGSLHCVTMQLPENVNI